MDIGLGCGITEHFPQIYFVKVWGSGHASRGAFLSTSPGVLVWVGITGQRFPRYHTIDHVYRFEASHTPAEVLKTVTLLDTPGILAGNWIGVSSKITAFASNVLVKKDKDQHLWGKNKLFFNSWEKQLETGIHDFTISFKYLLHFIFIGPRWTWGPIYGSGCPSVRHLVET